MVGSWQFQLCSDETAGVLNSERRKTAADRISGLSVIGQKVARRVLSAASSPLVDWSFGNCGSILCGAISILGTWNRSINATVISKPSSQVERAQDLKCTHRIATADHLQERGSKASSNLLTVENVTPSGLRNRRTLRGTVNRPFQLLVSQAHRGST